MSDALVDVETEKRAIAALLEAGSAVAGEVEQTRRMLDASGLAASHFTWTAAGILLDGIRSLVQRGRPAEMETVSFAVAPAMKPAQAVAAMGECQAVSSFWSWRSFPEYAERLKTLAMRRERRAFFAELARKAEDEKVPPDQLDQQAQRFVAERAASAEPYRTCAEDVYALQERITAAESGARPVLLPTGIELLDQHIGGLRPTLTLVGGLPAVGKTALLSTIVGNLAAQGIKCGVFGLEDATQWLTDRWVAHLARVPLAALGTRKPTREEADRLHTAMAEVHGWLQNVEKSAPEGSRRPADLVARAKDWVLNRGVRAVFVDHLGEIDHGNTRERHDISIGDTLIELRKIADQWGVAVIVAAHLRRDYERQASTIGKPRASDFADSAAIERKARLALGLWNGPDERTLRVSILKFTHGRPGATLVLNRSVAAGLVATTGGHIEQPNPYPQGGF